MISVLACPIQSRASLRSRVTLRSPPLSTSPRLFRDVGVRRPPSCPDNHRRTGHPSKPKHGGSAQRVDQRHNWLALLLGDLGREDGYAVPLQGKHICPAASSVDEMHTTRPRLIPISVWVVQSHSQRRRRLGFLARFSGISLLVSMVCSVWGDFIDMIPSTCQSIMLVVVVPTCSRREKQWALRIVCCKWHAISSKVTTAHRCHCGV